MNQADSHRERAALPADFPSLLVINTNIKNAASIEDKDQPAAPEQVAYASRNNVLIIRTIDLLFLIERRLTGSVTTAEVLELLLKSRGWPRVTSESCELVQG